MLKCVLNHLLTPKFILWPPGGVTTPSLGITIGIINNKNTFYLQGASQGIQRHFTWGQKNNNTLLYFITHNISSSSEKVSFVWWLWWGETSRGRGQLWSSTPGPGLGSQEGAWWWSRPVRWDQACSRRALWARRRTLNWRVQDVLEWMWAFGWCAMKNATAGVDSGWDEGTDQNMGRREGDVFFKWKNAALVIRLII